MKILELEYPGTWIKLTNEDEEFEVQNLFITIDEGFIEANISLNLFEKANKQLEPEHRNKEFEYRRQRLEELEKELRSKDSDDLYYSKLQEEIPQIIKRELIDKDILPTEVLVRTYLMHAKSFIYSLDCISSCIRKLENYIKSKSEIINILNDLDIYFPNLRDIRNTEHHLEDRVRGIGSNGGKMKVDNIINNNISENKLSVLTAKGEQKTIEVSYETLEKMQKIIQQAINVFNWEGPKKYCPM